MGEVGGWSAAGVLGSTTRPENQTYYIWQSEIKFLTALCSAMSWFLRWLSPQEKSQTEEYCQRS
jgi:hypothetical protein